MFLAAYYGLRRSEVVGLRWDAIDFERKTISIKHTAMDIYDDGQHYLVLKDRTKTKSSCRTLPLVAPFEELLLRIKEEQALNRRLCGNCYCTKYLDYIYVNELGELMRPDYLSTKLPKLLEEHNMRRIRFHDLRHSCASLLSGQRCQPEGYSVLVGSQHDFHHGKYLCTSGICFQDQFCKCDSSGSAGNSERSIRRF